MPDGSDPKYLQSGVIPFVIENGTVKILLVTSRSGERWVIPKGIIEGKATPLESAVREAYEEAGIKGKAYGRAIGEYRYQKWGGTCQVKVFLFKVNKVLKEWPEVHFRQRAWVSVEEAVKRVSERALKNMVRRVPILVDGLTDS